jgi:hypothetical protein
MRVAHGKVASRVAGIAKSENVRAFGQSYYTRMTYRGTILMRV